LQIVITFLFAFLPVVAIPLLLKRCLVSFVYVSVYVKSSAVYICVCVCMCVFGRVLVCRWVSLLIVPCGPLTLMQATHVELMRDPRLVMKVRSAPPLNVSHASPLA
jgi:hypothetical protein